MDAIIAQNNIKARGNLYDDDLSDVFETAFDRKERSHDFLWGGFIGIFP